MYFLATTTSGLLRASGQSSGGLWVENRAEIWFFFTNFHPFLSMCLFAIFCESGVHSYQFYWLQSTSSPILKFGVCWGHLVWSWFPLWYILICFITKIFKKLKKSGTKYKKKNYIWIYLSGGRPMFEFTQPFLRNYWTMHCIALHWHSGRCDQNPAFQNWAEHILAAIILLFTT